MYPFLLTATAVLAWLSVGVFGTGFLWKVLYARSEGKAPGALLIVSSVMWPPLWCGLACYKAISVLYDIFTSEYNPFSGFIAWTGKPIGIKKTKNIKA